MLLENLNIEQDVEGANEDFIPGSNFTFNTGVYPMQVKMAYLGESQNEAVSVTLWLSELDGNREHRETFYVTSNKDKGKKNTFTDRNGVKRLLPGMESMNQLALITTDKSLAQQKSEEKIIPIYNFTERKEVDTRTPVLTDMVGKTVLVCITKRRENKRAQIDGKWQNTNDERVFNEASKFLYPSGHTVAEKAGESDAEFRETWESKFGPDYVRDTYKPVGNAVAAASNAAAAANSAEVDSLFKED